MATLTARDYELFGRMAAIAESLGLQHVALRYRIAGCRGDCADAEMAFLRDYGRRIVRMIPRPSDDVT